MIKAGIIGGTGYTGAELLRLLSSHPDVELKAITSRAEAGIPVAELFPNLRGRVSLRFTEPDVSVLSECDVIFFATPHNVAMRMVPELLAAGVKVIDLSADFRITDAALWEQWYGESHVCPELLGKAVYALPETRREEIRSAQLLACPGCYPTSVQLGLLPLLESGLVDPTRLIANAASGVSGAGRQAKVDNLFAEVAGSFKAYGVAGHRHLPEIEQELSLAAASPVNLTFVPHLLPTVRGIHATLYSQLLDPAVSLDEVQFCFEARYKDEPFVDVMPAGSHPQTRTVAGTNLCRIAVHKPDNRDTLVVLSVIDNLVKGASGQAIQVMNIAFELPETRGLEGLAVLP